MSGIDWIVLSLTLSFIVLFGLWKSRGTKTIESFLLADKQLPWYHVGMSVIATQASAITFISAPGLAYTDGLRFIQFYFGLPIAMIVICTTFIPIFQKLNVFTAYEYLEKRFDNKTRSLTAILFLIQRGLSTGITIYAPSIILSTILSVDILYTTILMGSLVILYTVYGGTKAVSYTQFFQMIVIFAGLFIAGCMVVHLLPPSVSFTDALHIAGKMGKLQAIDTHLEIHNRYNLWSGIIGGFFLQLSYFGTDQSQVGRYLTGKSITQSRLGLVMNGLIKIPMQFLILLIGILVFSFYQYHEPPVFFNELEVQRIETSPSSSEYHALESSFKNVSAQKQKHVSELVNALHSGNTQAQDSARKYLQLEEKQSQDIRHAVGALMKKNNPTANADDANYIFLSFVTHYLPRGLVGLLIAIIFLASMGSTASGLNSLASTTVIDFYKRFRTKSANESTYLSASRWATIGWGLFCMGVAMYAHKLGNLIEAVNILGSLFYGTILGIFLVAFFLKRVSGTAVFCSALVSECFIVWAWREDLAAFLWLNMIGCLLVMVLSLVVEFLLPKRGVATTETSKKASPDYSGKAPGYFNN
jgi:SSS family solute:Na+ symporter